MCSTPKGSAQVHRPRARNKSTKMDYADYSAMVKRSNESYEKRQCELVQIRKEQALARKPDHAQLALCEESPAENNASSYRTLFRLAMEWLNQPIRIPTRRT